MNAPLSIILNKSILYNKRIALIFFICLYLLVLFTFLDKNFETSKGNLFLISTLYLCISICLYWLIKEKNYEFQKYSFNIDEYRLSSKKDKEKSYNEIFNRLLSEGLNNIKSDFKTSSKIDEFLLNIHNELNKNLKKSISFKRFDDYFTNSNNIKTTGKLFYFQYKKSLIKIIEDFIVNTNEFEDISNEIVSRFIHELTKLENLNFDSDKGLHYDDKFAFDFLENNNNQKLTRKQENSIPEQIKQIELKRISKTQFYKVLENTSKDVLKVQLTKENQEELKSFVGNLFTTKIKCNLSYDSNITKLNFINSENSKLFIMVMRYLQDKTMINLYNIDLIRTLDLIIKNDSIVTDSNKRISVIKSVTYQKLTSKQTKNVENILRNSKTQHT